MSMPYLIQRMMSLERDVSTDSAMIAKHGFYQTPFTDATRRGRRYLPLHHILSPRDPIFSG